MSGILLEYAGLRLSFFLSFAISLSGSVIYIVLESKEAIVIAIVVLLAKFGLGGAFNIVFLATSKLYPAIFASTVFGICNIFARLLSILSPIIAEEKEPVPILVFLVLASIATLLSLFIITPDENDFKKKV